MPQGTAYLAVTTVHPEQVKSYLYATATPVGEPIDLGAGRSGIVVRVVAADDAVSVARQQSDRLASGMHGAVVVASERKARMHLDAKRF